MNQPNLIIKLQHTDDEQKVLVTTQDGSYSREFETNSEWDKMIHGEREVYYAAWIDENGHPHIGNQFPHQGW